MFYCCVISGNQIKSSEEAGNKTDVSSIDMQDMPEIKREGFALLRETARRKKAKRNNTKHISGGDALRGNTRTHPEHEG